MKKLMFLVICINGMIAAQQLRIPSIEETGEGYIRHSEKNAYAASMSYVNGGITFNYPAGWFTGTPIVNVSLEVLAPLLPFSLNNLIVPQIVSHSSTSITIRCMLANILILVPTVVEAVTGSVQVNIMAIDS